MVAANRDDLLEQAARLGQQPGQGHRQQQFRDDHRLARIASASTGSSRSDASVMAQERR
ncbi:hypothetical protein [Marinobacterium aestuariivivens]|uniref:Uncharacterized protein n=1 Tax=Marinobacterium aestuariivivens TaxID=1698799 RepID=A0ABW2A7T5_9GAMM